jgi:hypothetical protein
LRFVLEMWSAGASPKTIPVIRQTPVEKGKHACVRGVGG